MNLAQLLISTYIKAGCIGWVAMTIGIAVMSVRLTLKYGLSTYEAADAVNTVNGTTNGGQKREIDWPKTLVRIAVWPYGMWMVAKNWSAYEKKLVKELEKRRTQD